MDIVTLIIEVIVGAFTTAVTGLGTAINTMFTNLFLVTDATTKEITGLSALAGWSIAFMGISFTMTILWRFLKRVA